MSYYEQNIESIKQYKSSFYDKIMKIDLAECGNQLSQVFSQSAINGEPILILQREDTQYRLNSSYNPTHEAVIWAEQFGLNNLNNVIMMYGLGNGCLAKELESRLNEQDILFIYEPSQQIFAHVLEEYSISELSSKNNVILCIEGINDYDFHVFLQRAVNITNLLTLNLCAHPHYTELFPESHIKFYKEIKDVMVHTKININTEIKFGKRLIINSFKNIKYIKNSYLLIDFLRDINTDIPAIIVAAGPSVEANIEELKRAKGRSYIFVVDRALDYVLDNGLEPDFIVTVDPIKPVEYFTRRNDVTIPLLCEPASNWEILEHHKGKKIIYNCSEYFKQLYKAVGINSPFLITGASVATAAFTVCVGLGFNKIVLVGQDLAYSGDATHAGGIKESIYEKNEIVVEGMDGKSVRSRYDWYEFLIWFQDAIKLCPNIQVIDTKSKGAKIKGSIPMSMKEVIDKYCTIDNDLEAIIKKADTTFHEPELIRIKKFLAENRDEFYSLKKKAKEAIELCDIQLREYHKDHENTGLTDKNYRKLTKINKTINETVTYPLISPFMTSLTADDLTKIYQFSEDEKTNRIRTYELSKNIYKAVIEGAEFVMPILDIALEQYDIS